MMKAQVFPSDSRPIGNGMFRFDCRPDLACFTKCCMDADMCLYPYDVIRMKQRLEITSVEFLEKYTFSAVRDNRLFPNVMLRMAERPGKPCPLLVPLGCSIYEDRPSSCREYPLERAVARSYAQGQRESHYFVKRASHCQGHQEEKEWTVKAWIADQQIGPYIEMNDLWVDMDTIFRQSVWGKGEEASKKLRMAFMGCFNVDQFRRFVLESSFLFRFDVSEKYVEKMKTDDIEMMRFGFEWVKYFLTGRPSFTFQADQRDSQR